MKRTKLENWKLELPAHTIPRICRCFAGMAHIPRDSSSRDAGGFNMTPSEIKTKLRPFYDAALSAISKGADIAAINQQLTLDAVEALRSPRYDLTQYQLCLPVDKAGEARGVAVYVTLPNPHAARQICKAGIKCRRGCRQDYCCICKK